MVHRHPFCLDIDQAEALDLLTHGNTLFFPGARVVDDHFVRMMVVPSSCLLSSIVVDELWFWLLDRVKFVHVKTRDTSLFSHRCGHLVLNLLFEELPTVFHILGLCDVAVNLRGDAGTTSYVNRCRLLRHIGQRLPIRSVTSMVLPHVLFACRGGRRSAFLSSLARVLCQKFFLKPFELFKFVLILPLLLLSTVYICIKILLLLCILLRWRSLKFLLALSCYVIF